MFDEMFKSCLGSMSGESQSEPEIEVDGFTESAKEIREILPELFDEPMDELSRIVQEYISSGLAICCFNINQLQTVMNILVDAGVLPNEVGNIFINKYSEYNMDECYILGDIRYNKIIFAVK